MGPQLILGTSNTVSRWTSHLAGGLCAEGLPHWLGPPLPSKQVFHPGLPFPQVAEHSVVPSCFQLWSRLLLGGCGAGGTKLSGRWAGNLSGCLTGKVCVCEDAEVSTSGASARESSFSWFLSRSSLFSRCLSSASNCPLNGSPGRGSTAQG